MVPGTDNATFVDDEDLIEAVYGSANFREAVVAFTSGASKK